MSTPFPGMDPYLERRERWHAVHTRLIVAIADALGPQVRPHYRVDIELRTYVALLTSTSPAGVPDVLVMSSPQGSDQGDVIWGNGGRRASDGRSANARRDP